MEDRVRRRSGPAWVAVTVGVAAAALPAAGQGTAGALDPALSSLTHLHLFPTSAVPGPWQGSVELGQITTFGGARAEGGGGTGNQTYHGWIEIGLPGRVALMGFIQGNDDPTWGRLNGVRYQQETFVIGGGARVVVADGTGWTVSAQGTLARLDLKSDPGLFTSEPGMRRTFHHAGSFAVMATSRLGTRWELTVSPGADFLPSRVNGLAYYGWSATLGAGLVGRVGSRWRIFGAGDALLGPGDNSVDRRFRFRRIPVWSAGAVFDAGPRTRVTAFVTNASGGSHGTRHLTHLGTVPFQWGARVRYSPTAPDPAPAPGTAAAPRLSSADGPEGAPPGSPRQDGGGVLAASPHTLPSLSVEVRGSADGEGGRSARLRVGLSREAELEVGLVRTPGLAGGSRLGIRLGEDLHYRMGGKLALLARGWGHPVSAAARVAVGRDSGTRQGYLVAELPVHRHLGAGVGLTATPALLSTGGESPAALSLTVGASLPRGVRLLVEPTLVSGGRPVLWSAALGTPVWRGVSGEVFATTALGTMGAGRFLYSGGTPRLGLALSVRPR